MNPAGPLLDNDHLFAEICARLRARDLFDEDVTWSENVQPPTEPDAFARETIFVIANSGMHHDVARQIYQRCLGAIDRGESCTTVFGHVGKATAMDRIWADRADLLAGYNAADDKIAFCRSLPWIGGITCYHLAKNFGAAVAKPDVHLMRLAERHATNPQDLCAALAERTGYKISTIDLILWRACAVGILDGNTSELVAPKPPAPPPEPYQQPLFQPVQAEMFPF
ncbi:hypothetical protein [Sphingosinicella sp. BN140058]|uniref:hypothetical protein n=1 Tax=Sphingosinicella sp. BN140058 TaxID=1892855 RepID=UPI0010121F19|nr:hypothetical protein [Sphingosinicella sp. BN140058]QAY80463.1 hypothetical protein ETR14_27890 [Sphingosinicella sp. BN140058]